MDGWRIDEQQIGYRARVYRALFNPRMPLGLPRELCALYWGPVLSITMCAPVSRLAKVIGLVLAVIIHVVMAWLGRKNPYWLVELRRKWNHADVSRR